MGKSAKQRRDAKYRELSRYMIFVEEVLGSLLPQFKQFNPPIVRTRHWGPFGGTADNFDVNFIFATRVDTSEAQANGVIQTAADKTISVLRERGYPPEALLTFRFRAVSEEEIEEGGGDFAYWR
jgi:hypothetical protein